VLYEDFRIERGALLAAEGSLGEIDTLGNHYRTMYFIRRLLGTLHEFQGCLTQLLATREFKDAKHQLFEKHRDHIDSANLYFQRHVERMKDLRNEFGGHLKATAVEFATRTFAPEAIGKVSFDSSNPTERLWLELHYANELVVGIISSKVQGGDVHQELVKALEMIFDSYGHVLGATYALVHGFIWNRFGR
jgi:hypothetical protein